MIKFVKFCQISAILGPVLFVKNHPWENCWGRKGIFWQLQSISGGAWANYNQKTNYAIIMQKYILVLLKF